MNGTGINQIKFHAENWSFRCTVTCSLAGENTASFPCCLLEQTEFSAGSREHQNHVWYLGTNLLTQGTGTDVCFQALILLQKFIFPRKTTPIIKYWDTLLKTPVTVFLLSALGRTQGAEMKSSSQDSFSASRGINPVWGWIYLQNFNPSLALQAGIGSSGRRGFWGVYFRKNKGK